MPIERRFNPGTGVKQPPIDQPAPLDPPESDEEIEEPEDDEETEDS